MTSGSSPESTYKKWWVPVWELVVHVFIGSFLFAVIAVPGVGLDLGVKWLKEELRPSEFTIDLLTWVKYAALAIDGFLYIVFLLWLVVQFIRGICRQSSRS